MKVSYYFRNPGAGKYSIENVFNPIITKVREHSEVEIFQVRKPLDLLAILKVSRIHADIHHITGAENYLAIGLPTKKTILTVHDIGHLTKTLKGFKKSLYQKIYWEIPPLKKIIMTTVSEFTKEQILDNFDFDPDRIRVIPNPLNKIFGYRKKNFSYDQPVILQIGGGKNKNIESLIEAIKGLNYKLLLVRPPEPWVISLLDKNKISYEFRYNLTEGEVAQAYFDSDIVYFASTYEGFGLPIIEAQAIGRPVITSNITAMPEALIVKDSAIVVNPYSIDEIKEVIIKLTLNSEMRENLIKNGILNAANFSVEAIAKKYNNLYEEIKNGK